MSGHYATLMHGAISGHILAENGGWAVFIYTPRGKNHGHSLYQMAKKSNEWFCQNLTINDTKRADGSPVYHRTS
jgi:poly-beta-hydroxyalkanoate depolymerase